MFFYKGKRRNRISDIKKIICIPLTLAAFCGASVCAAEIPPVPVPTEDSYSATAEIPVTDILIGDSVYVNIATKPQAQAYGFEFFLGYDSQKLKYDRVEIKGAAADGIIKVADENGRLCVVATAVGGVESGDDDEIGQTTKGIMPSGAVCTVVFTAKSGGNCEFKLESFKSVYEDMTYFESGSISFSASVEVKDPKADNDKKSGGSSGGGGGRGGGFSVGGETTSTTAPIPDKPNISDDENITDNDKNDDSSQTEFVDLDRSHWAYESIAAMSKSGIINGFEDKTFRPEAAVTRAEFCKMLCGILKTDADESADTDFSDVSRSDWFYDAVRRLAQSGIVKGSDGMFRPDDNITREDAAVIIKRFAEYCGAALGVRRESAEFDDNSDISDYAKSAVGELYVSEIINGSDNNRFEPKQSMTRAQAAAMIARIKTIIDSGREV